MSEPDKPVAVSIAASAFGTSGVADYARFLACALRDIGYEVRSQQAAVDVAIYNYAPYAAGVYLGWLRGVHDAWRLRRLARRLVVVFHEVFERPDDRLRMRVFAMLQRWATRRLVAAAAATVVADASRARRLASLCPRLPPPAIVPVGPNVPIRDVGRRAAPPVVVTFGLLHPDRDLETLVEAAGLLRQDVPRLRVRIIGDLRADAARARRLRELVETRAAPVAIEGKLSANAIADALADARVFVSTYTRAVSLGSGTVAAALAYGLAVVVYDGVELHEELVPGSTVLVAEREPYALAATISAALGAVGERVGASGRALYERRLAWPRIAERMAGVIDRSL